MVSGALLIRRKVQPVRLLDLLKHSLLVWGFWKERAGQLSLLMPRGLSFLVG